MKIADIVLRIRLDVNDLDKDRWQDEYIIDVLNEAMVEAFYMRPDWFQEAVIAELEEGELQQVCCCSVIQSVDALVDGAGVWVGDIRAVEVLARSALGRKRGCGGWEYTLDRDNRFWIYPPVRPNEKVFVRLTCAKKPDTLGFDMDKAISKPELYGALIDFALYRLLGGEMESATSAQKSAAHRAAFYEKLGAQGKIKREYQKKSTGAEK